MSSSSISANEAVKPLLLEIGVEELPARFVAPAIQQLQSKIEKWLDGARISYGEVRLFATPRRLAVLVADVACQQPDIAVEVRGPAKKIALTADGSWSQAALGFARSQGVAVDQFVFREFNGVEYIYANKESKGAAVVDLLPEALKSIVESLTFAKNMRWGNHELRYARPIRWLVALYGEHALPFAVTGVNAGRTSQGHRFLGGPLAIDEPTAYAERMRSQYVIADLQERQAAIVAQIEALAAGHDWHVPIDEQLLDEVTSLVEYPTVLSGRFSEEFLQVPQDVLITSMREHQRYFPVLDRNGKLLPHFITVRNGDSRSLEQVAKGNEKVLRARLSDARFFYAEDQKMDIARALTKLEKIVYQEELGTIADKVRRMADNARELCTLLELNQQTAETVDRIARICKFDLVTSMVYEFPELQGVMGEDYALKLGETAEVARAIREHYMPRFAGDRVPTDKMAAVVSIADKIDTIVGCFSLGLIPSGSQDPYALRRHAAGIVQIIDEHGFSCSISQLVAIACRSYRTGGTLKRAEQQMLPELTEFFGLRLKNTLSERGVRYDVIDAVLGAGFDDIRSTLARAASLSAATRQTSTFKSVTEALQRSVNIAAKQTALSLTVNEALFADDSETRLYAAWKAAHATYDQARNQTDESTALAALVSLEAPITDFFNRVMVMVEDAAVRNNRLALLQLIAQDVRTYADFAKLVW